jgi:amidase
VGEEHLPGEGAPEEEDPGASEPGASGRGTMDRRRFLRYSAYSGALAAAGSALPAIAGTTRAWAAGTAAPASPSPSPSSSAASSAPAPFPFEETTIVDLQAAMSSGKLTARQLTQAYIGRIDAIDLGGIQLNSVLELNPDALAIADQLDNERLQGKVRGPLHGIPILIKDNIATADRMETTAGSFALLGSKVPADAFVAEKLRRAGAILMGKTNLSEWANFRSFQSSSGWSGRAGQCLNPYVLDHNPCGSSSGTGAAIAASLAAAGLGSETDGSIVCPSSNSSLVGIKVTLGLTSRSGVIPIAHSQDVVGPMGRTVADAAALLGAMTGVDPLDPATKKSVGHSYQDYTQFLDPKGVQGARLGIWRDGVFGFSPEGDQVAEEAFKAMANLGATMIDGADINQDQAFDPEFTVLLYEFKNDINLYLAGLTSSSVRTLKDLIKYNDDHAAVEMPWFGQELFLLAQLSGPLTDPVYLDALKTSKKLMRDAINGVMDQYNLDAVVTLTSNPPWTTDLVNGDHFLTGSSTPAAVAGFPSITVPAGYSFGELPVGVSFIGRAWDEPKLIKLASGFEAGTKARHAPKYIPSLGVQDFVPRSVAVDDARPAGHGVVAARAEKSLPRIGARPRPLGF